MFRDREAAGGQVAAAIREEGVPVDLVLAIPRGGLPVGRAVADELGVPLDIVAAKKLSAPGNPELGIGAVAADGSLWLNDSLIDGIGVTREYVDSERARAAEVASEKAERYREGRSPPDIAGRSVAIVDDGVATGATMRVCLRAVRAAGAARVILAVPVGAPDSLAALADAVDAVIAVERPSSFSAVAQHYASFPQVTDEEAMAYLRRE
ncbi:MAG: phosphoribosyltransferase [Halodesulfurarchaeum sp.]